MSGTKTLLTQDEIDALNLGITLGDYMSYKEDMAEEGNLFGTFIKLTNKVFAETLNKHNNTKGDK